MKQDIRVITVCLWVVGICLFPGLIQGKPVTRTSPPSPASKLSGSKINPVTFSPQITKGFSHVTTLSAAGPIRLERFRSGDRDMLVAWSVVKRKVWVGIQSPSRTLKYTDPSGETKELLPSSPGVFYITIGETPVYLEGIFPEDPIYHRTGTMNIPSLPGNYTTGSGLSMDVRKIMDPEFLSEVGTRASDYLEEASKLNEPMPDKSTLNMEFKTHNTDTTMVPSLSENPWKLELSGNDGGSLLLKQELKLWKK